MERLAASAIAFQMGRHALVMPDNHCLGFVAVHVKHYQSLSTLADTTSAMVQTSPVEDNRNDSPDVDMNTLSDSKDSARDPKTRAEQIHGSTWAIPDVFTSQELASDANDELDVSDMGESRTKRHYDSDDSGSKPSGKRRRRKAEDADEVRQWSPTSMSDDQGDVPATAVPVC